MTGSTRIARRAGITDAVRPATASTTHPLTNVSGSVAVTPNSCASMYRVPRSAPVRPIASSDPEQSKSLSQQQRDNRCRLRTHGEANSDFRRPLGRGVRHHSVETKHREYQRDGAKEADECGHHPLPAQRSIQNIAEQLRTLDGKLAVDLPHGFANRRHERHGVARGAHVQRDARLVVLRQQQVVGRRPLALQRGGVDRIGDDADDDLQLVAFRRATSCRSDPRVARAGPPGTGSRLSPAASWDRRTH